MTTNDLDRAREWIDADEVAAIAENITAASHGFPPEYQGKLRTWAKRLRASLPQQQTTQRRWATIDRTTDEWAALLDGTTPGPWFTDVRGFGRIENIGPIYPGFNIGDGLDCDKDDAELAGIAPEAVAEVVRLRRAITDLRDEYLEHIADYDEATVTHMCYGTAAHDLDRILNGDTNDPA